MMVPPWWVSEPVAAVDTGAMAYGWRAGDEDEGMVGPLRRYGSPRVQQLH